MFDRSSGLARGNPCHRAELLQTLKSLEIARDTQQRLKPAYLCPPASEESRRLKERFASNISHNCYPAQYHSGIHRDYASHRKSTVREFPT